ncbi:MAG TPA: CPBP family intramembrane glutamic endopeptidase [Verrucomicrobiae bacterium]|jgi:membrane protease YdiL (CAAX protease family)|nr:CPBP family intramembrane glutamic endopeptidase [Verrucomicrobiae bacterium]
MTGERQFSVWTALGLWAAGVAAATLYGLWQGYGGRALAVAAVVLAFFLAIQLLLAVGNAGERMARRAGSNFGVLLSFLPFAVYLVYARETGTFGWRSAALAGAFTLVPLLLAISAGAAKAGAWQDYLSMIAIFLPVKLGWLVRLWPYPSTQFAYFLSMLLAVNVALATFLFVRQFDGVGYNIVWSRDAVLAVLIHFAILAVILIPLGMALHFIRFDPSQAHWKSLPADVLSIFLLTAWPEEFLFRGLLQNSLSRSFSNETAGWFTASVIFGLAHITNNGVFPNWRYALLATIAGIFYGRTWRKTNSIFTSAIVHALVDTIWHVTFRTL